MKDKIIFIGYENTPTGIKAYLMQEGEVSSIQLYANIHESVIDWVTNHFEPETSYLEEKHIIEENYAFNKSYL